MTAYRALFEHGRTGPGKRVLVLGTGGVSMFAILLAIAAGADVAVVSRDPAKLERALALGARWGVCSTNEPEWGVTVREATIGGVDHVIDVAGGSTLKESLRAVRPGGTISLIGSTAGTRGAPSLLPAVMREVRLQGILVGPRSSFFSLAELVENSTIRPIIDATFPLEDASHAFQHMASGRAFGKIVVAL